MVPNAWELVFPQVPVEGWVLHTYEHGFLDGPGMVVNFLVYYTILLWVHGVSCGGAMQVNGGRCLEMFLDPFSQWSAWFPYVSTGAVYVGTFVVVDDPCLAVLGSLSLWLPNNVLSVLVPLKCTCCSAVFMCWSSLSSLSCEEETTFDLCASVLNTLCLAVMWWLLSQSRYWSVWVGFL